MVSTIALNVNDMKANELMTGDYFRIAQTGKIIKIVAIDEYSGSVDYFDGDAGGVLTIGVEKIVPIRLVAEILEKNGFDCSETIGFAKLSFVGGSNEGKFILRAMYDIKSDKQKGWGFFAFNVLTEVNYVHDLQHALRLCKIDKKITL